MGSRGEEPGLWVTLPEGIVKLLSQWVRPVLLLELIVEEGERVRSSVYHVAGPGLAHVWGIYRLWERQSRGGWGASLLSASLGLLSLVFAAAVLCCSSPPPSRRCLPSFFQVLPPDLLLSVAFLPGH